MSNQNHQRDQRDQRGQQQQQKNDGQRERAGLVPVGRHKVKCIDYAWGWTKGSASEPPKEQLGLSLEIVDGPHAGQVLGYYGFFTEKTALHTIKAMRALGWQGNDFARCDTLKTAEALAVVEHENDEDGVPRARVRWINTAGVAMKSPMNGAQIAHFSASMRGLAASIGADGQQSTSSSESRSLPPRGNGGGNSIEEQRRRDQGRNDQGYSRQLPPRDEPPPRDDDAPPYERGGREGGGYQNRR